MFMKEDRYNLGEFFYGMDFLLYKYRPVSEQEKHQLVLGDLNQVEQIWRNGNSSIAAFAWIFDVVQPSSTTLLIADGLNKCIQHYDYETDLVSTLIGSCAGFREAVKIFPPLTLYRTASANQTTLGTVTSIALVESTTSLLLSDNGQGTILKYDFDTELVSLLAPMNSLPESGDILLNPEETKVFVSFAKGISFVSLATGIIKPLIEGNHPNIIPGGFTEAKMRRLDSLSWLVPGKVIMGIPYHTDVNTSSTGLVTIDLELEVVSLHCAGMYQKQQQRDLDRLVL